MNHRCNCGEWAGAQCQWVGPLSDMVVVEWVPPANRASAAAGHNDRYGSRRDAVSRECAEAMLRDAPWVEITDESPDGYVDCEV